MARVLCAMSGGVDSSVAAALLQQAGHEVLGIFLRLGSGAPVDSSKSRGCCSISDARDAARVVDRLGVPFYALNYQQDFERIIEYFVDEYNDGRTPNPCARCNQWLKFGSLREQAKALGCESVATGHYARIDPPVEANARPQLRRGHDRSKDQSYFLFSIAAESLPVTLFPVGQYTKSHIRELAAKFSLPVAEKPDSQEICFVPNGDYRTVIQDRTPDRVHPGVFVDIEGKEIGAHDGYQNFTIGQRRGLKMSFGKPRYVVAINPAANTITFGPRDSLACRMIDLEEMNWLSMDEPAVGESFEADVQIRYRSPPVRARVGITAPGQAQVELSEPRDAVTPGQAGVLYRGDVVLGGGWIRG